MIAKACLAAVVGLLIGAASAHAATVDVRVYNFDYSSGPVGDPAIDPIINLGDTIRWVWESGFHDTVSATGYSESWASPLTSQVGFTFEHTFTNLGEFPYYCSVHGFDNGDGTVGGMSGTITVVPEPASVGLLGLGGLGLIRRRRNR